jgi:small subunit ribosomal protein S17
MTTDTTAAPTPTESDARSHKRTLIGKVKSAKMQKTVVVEVVRSVRHPIYGKYVRRRKSYKAHDEQGQYKAGDVVEIREHKPISREKRWLVVRLVVRPVEA